MNIFDAAQKGNLFELQARIQEGINVNERYRPHDMAALDYVAVGDYTECAEALLLAGAEVNALSARKDSPLHHAAIFGHSKTLEVLLKYGADPDLQNHSRSTALHISAKNNDLHSVSTLLAAGADFTLLDHENLQAEEVALNIDVKRLIQKSRVESEKSTLSQSVAEIAPALPSVPRKRMGGVERDR